MEATTAAATMQVDIRPATPDDLAFVFSTWLKHHRNSSTHEFFQHFPNTVYYTGHHRIIRRILKRSRALVATVPGDKVTVLGYLVDEPGFQFSDEPAPTKNPSPLDGRHHLLHFIFVKPAFRRTGIADQLMKHAGLDPKRCLVSHMTSSARALCREKGLYPTYVGPFGW